MGEQRDGLGGPGTSSTPAARYGTVDVTVIDLSRPDVQVAVPAVALHDDVAVHPEDVPIATGWDLKDGRLCRGDVCVPTPVRPVDATADGPVSITAVADALGTPAVVDVAARLVVLGVAPAQRVATITEMRLPPIALPTTGGDTLQLDELRGRKTLLVAWASWCGCRYDLPRWQELHDELAPSGFAIVGVAVDEDVADVRPWVDDAGVRFPVVVDRDHRVVDALSITHVPTVLWCDEDGTIVRPNTVAFADDTFTSVHGVRAEPHLTALRRWVHDDDAGIDAATAAARAPLPSFDAQLARAEFAAAVHLHRRGDDTGAARHFDRAEQLAPDDFTIRRASMPLRGRNPFGPEFFAWYEEWRARGEPGYDHMR
jgi:peroxiredoxin